ncbi:uL30 family ribosomal protein [Candidatus Pacearchaeota archaeon]|nr:uL30 family ribosomal protein [Candidatus Pacearchaeota archaeon]
MIAIIRIKGQVKVRTDVLETLDRMGLKKKYSCAILDKPTKVDLGMLKKVENFVAYGEITPETYKKLVEARGKFSKSKTHFRLHPPRKGIESKKHFGVGKGVLGNNKEKINELVLRML